MIIMDCCVDAGNKAVFTQAAQRGMVIIIILCSCVVLSLDKCRCNNVLFSNSNCFVVVLSSHTVVILLRCLYRVVLQKQCSGAGACLFFRRKPGKTYSFPFFRISEGFV